MKEKFNSSSKIVFVSIFCILIFINNLYSQPKNKNKSFKEIILHNSLTKILTKIIKENDSYVFADLGYDILKIPRSNIKQIKNLDISKNKLKSNRVNFKNDINFSNTKEIHTNNIFSYSNEKKIMNSKQLALFVGDAVVKIKTPTSVGSGFIINERGFIVTNHHVIDGEHKLEVILYHKTKNELEKILFKKVKIVAMNPYLDLALLKIEDTNDKKFSYVSIGHSNQVKQGQNVYAVGSPLGLDRSVSHGIVSLVNRSLKGLTYIQHTSEISPGN